MKKLLAFAIILFSIVSLADSKRLVVKIEGLTCPSCAASIESQFKNLNQVDSVDISIRKGTATVVLKEGKVLEDLAINRAVKNAGYKLISIERN